MQSDEMIPPEYAHSCSLRWCQHHAAQQGVPELGNYCLEDSCIASKEEYRLLQLIQSLVYNYEGIDHE